MYVMLIIMLLIEILCCIKLTNSRPCHENWLVGWLVGWLFNAMSTQKGQFMPTEGEGNRLSQLGMANEIQCILPYVTR